MKYEYKYIRTQAHIMDKKSPIIINDELNKLGEEGWELVGFANDNLNEIQYFVFKRTL